MPSVLASAVTMATAVGLLQTVRIRSRRAKRPFVQVVSQALDHSVVRVGDQELRFQLTLPPDTIEPLFSGAAWAGTVVWPAAVYLANYLRFQRLCQGDTVVELGAGVGLPGIVAGLLGAKRVILTEQPPLSELLDRNIKQLFPLGSSNDCKFEVATLDWNDPIPSSVGKVDLILVSDCIYEGLYGESWRALANVLNSLLTLENCALNCVERRKEDGIDRFLELCETKYSIRSVLVATVETNERITQLYEMRQISQR